MFPRTYVAGVSEALCWSSSTIIIGGCEEVAPAGLLGRDVGDPYDSPILRHYFKNHPGTKQQSCGVGLQQGSPYRKEVTRALLKLREDGVLEELEAKYFGKTTAASR